MNENWYSLQIRICFLSHWSAKEAVAQICRIGLVGRGCEIFLLSLSSQFNHWVNSPMKYSSERHLLHAPRVALPCHLHSASSFVLTATAMANTVAATFVVKTGGKWAEPFCRLRREMATSRRIRLEGNLLISPQCACHCRPIRRRIFGLFRGGGDRDSTSPLLLAITTKLADLWSPLHECHFQFMNLWCIFTTAVCFGDSRLVWCAELFTNIVYPMVPISLLLQP